MESAIADDDGQNGTGKPEHRVSSARYWLWKPPGVAFYVAAIIASLYAVWVSSVGSVGTFALPMLWLPFCFLWLVRFVGALVVTAFDVRPTEWLRWIAVPVILGLAFLLTMSDVPFRARLALSRGAMDQVAAEVMAGGSTSRSTIGLFEVEQVERIPRGMRFLVSTAGFIDRKGFAYSTDGMPADPDGHATYEHLDGNWWIWTDRFD
jgi:hypothetical protein